MSEISPPAPSEPAEQLLLYQSVHDRIGYPLMWRVCGLSIFTWFTAAVLGVLSSSKMAALRFRAENSHRFPTTTTGWYYYHKSKNNYVIHAGITQGLKSAFKFPPMITSILFFENAVDQYRGKKDLLSSVIGSLSTACLFSLRNRFNLVTTMHVARIGLVGGLGFGFLQDLHALGRGERLDYVEYLKGITGKMKGDTAEG